MLEVAEFLLLVFASQEDTDISYAIILNFLG